jgi:hypothetical protein
MRSARNFRMGKAAVLLAVSILISIVLSSPAYSSTSLTVKVSNGGSYSATASQVVLTNTRTHFPVVCSTIGSTLASQIAGTITNGTRSGAAPVNVGKATTLAFQNCAPGPLGGSVTITSGKLPYNISVDSATTSKGETDLIISGIDISWVATGCTFILTGSVQGYYSNSTNTLVLTSNLPVSPLDKAQLSVSKSLLTKGLAGWGGRNRIDVVTVGWCLRR